MKWLEKFLRKTDKLVFCCVNACYTRQTRLTQLDLHIANAVTEVKISCRFHSF